MLVLGTIAFLASAAAAPALPADFSLLSTPTPQSQAGPPTPEATPRVAGPARQRPYAPVAQGFGDHVPLSFAVRQIVPRGIPVHIGPGIDTDAAITWAGGRAWHRVLAAAVAPLGYRVRVGWNGVTIAR